MSVRSTPTKRESAVLAVLLALHGVLPAAAQESSERPRFAPYDGKGNHAANPTWNAAGSPLIRYPVSETGYPVPSGEYMAGVGRPSARAISVAVVNSPYFKERDQSRGTNLVSVVGQYATADISKALDINSTTDNSSQPIAVPLGDPWMSNFSESGGVSPHGTRSSLLFKRSQYVIDSAGVRQQINSVTGFLDASVVYGSSALAARRLRAGSGGLMRDDGNRGLPFNEDPVLAAEGGAAAAKLVNMSNAAKSVPASRLRAAGFAAANQNPGLLSLATVFLREHNRRAAEAVRLNPSFGDEEAFQYARKWVIAHWQHVVFDEYIPALLGATLPMYGGYNASTHPGIDNFFSTAAYRYGHATITDVVFRLDEHWQEHPEGHLLLSQVWFQPDKALSAGIEPLLRGFVASPRGSVGMPFSAAVQQNLFGPSHINGTDLLALNIQRGRDHGMPDYNTCRRLFGLPPAASFSNITPDATLAAKLEQLYGSNINNVDAYVGGLAEPHFGSAHVGQLFYASIFDQFRRLRDGDWYYFKNADNGLFNAQEVAEIESTGLRDLIMRNTNITELPDSVWVLEKESILGVCPANAAGSNASNLAGGGSSSASVAGPFKLLGGAVELVISKAADPSKMRVQITGKFDTGYIGFGVAKPDQPVGQKMVGADMVIARMDDGKPSVLDYHAIGHIPPVLDTGSGGSNNVVLISFERSGGSTVVVFERPFAALDANGLDNAVQVEGPNTFIVSHGADDSLNYHGIDNRAVLQLNGVLFGGDTSGVSVETTADSRAIKLRTQHGTLMAVNFIVVFPLGALMARQLRARWLNSLAAKAVLFYMHIAVQMSGVALATAGFIIATKDFGIPYKDVLMHHGTLGVAILTLVYFQLLIGFVRPPAVRCLARSLWQLGHAMLGRMALMLGIVNVFIGIYLFSTLYKGNVGLWGGLAAAGLATIALLQIVGDLLERRASELLAARMAHLPLGGKPPPTNPSTPRGGDSLNHHASTVADDDINPRDPGYSPGPAVDDQFKPYPASGPQHHFGGGQFGGPAAGGGFGTGGAFIGSIASGFSPPGGSGMGSCLHYGPVPDDDALYRSYNPQYNPQYNQQYSQQQYNQPPISVASNTHSHQYAPAGAPAGSPAAAAEGVFDEETGSASPPEAAAAAMGSRVSFGTDITDDTHSHQQQQRQQGGNNSNSAGPHPSAASAAAFNSDAYSGPIRKAFGSFSGVGGMLLRRNTINNSSMETPRLNYSPAADSKNAVFCDYETAGVYDPSSGAFKAAGHTKKQPVQELHLPSGRDHGLGFGGPGSLNPNPSSLPRRASASSVSGSRSYNGGGGSSSGGDMLGRTGSNWREAAAEALQKRTGNPSANASAAANGGGGSAAGGSSMYGASIASKLAAAKAALDVESNADGAAAAAAPGSPGVSGNAGGGANKGAAGAGAGAGEGGGGGGSGSTVRLTMSMLDRHNRT